MTIHQRTLGIISVAIVMGVAAPACGGSHPRPDAPASQTSVSAAPQSEPVAKTPPPPPQHEEKGTAYTATVIALSPEIQRGCDLPEKPGEAPHFDYDESQLRARGENILDDVARCLTSGRLQGHSITIIGRADPRGSDQYNQSLGRDRATVARSYLIEKGVPAQRILFTSRGELGAKGTDKESWQLDRRVDIELSKRDQSPSSPTTGSVPDDLRLTPHP